MKISGALNAEQLKGKCNFCLHYIPVIKFDNRGGATLQARGRCGITKAYKARTETCKKFLYGVGRICSDGEKTKKHGISCGGEIKITYDENRWYTVHCENCGEMLKIKTKSMDWAIKFWNDCPDAVGNYKGGEM